MLSIICVHRDLLTPSLLIKTAVRKKHVSGNVISHQESSGFSGDLLQHTAGRLITSASFSSFNFLREHQLCGGGAQIALNLTFLTNMMILKWPLR
jgi:hypothetical protein